jgi:putative Mg2+ transporter-C (MgtC) family protein
MFWYEIVFRVLLAAIIGMAVGFQREFSGHPAGIKTHAMVSIGAAVISLIQLQMFSENPDVDPTRIIAQVVSGIGFIGAGCILRNDRSDKISGLTTASTLWVVGCLGIAVGLGYYLICLASFTAVMIILTVVSLLRAGKKVHEKDELPVDHD